MTDSTRLFADLPEPDRSTHREAYRLWARGGFRADYRDVLAAVRRAGVAVRPVPPRGRWMTWAGVVLVVLWVAAVVLFATA